MDATERYAQLECIYLFIQQIMVTRKKKCLWNFSITTVFSDALQHTVLKKNSTNNNKKIALLVSGSLFGSLHVHS